MKLSNWEIIYTILVFLTFIAVTALNSYYIYKIKRDKDMKKYLFWTLISLSEITIFLAFLFKILSFSFFLSSYKTQVIFANWMLFTSIILTILTLVFIPFDSKKQKTNNKKENHLKKDWM